VREEETQEEEGEESQPSPQRPEGHVMRRLLITTTLVVAVLSPAAGAATASASSLTPSPWWGITTGSRPTELRALLANEVQRVTVQATGGEFLLANEAELFSSGFTKGFAIFKWDASAAEVQAGLEGIYGAGNVRVLKGQGNAAGSEPYEVEFTKALASQNVALLFAFGESTILGGKENLQGVISADQLKKGSPDGQLVVEAQNLGDAPAGDCSAVAAGGGKYRDAACSEVAGTAAEGVFEKTPVTITDRLPEGLTAVSAEGIEGAASGHELGPVSCVIASAGQEAGREVTCTYEAAVPPYQQIEILISARVEPDAKSGEVNTATVSGGGATGTRATTHKIEVNGAERFGIETYSLVPENLGGSIDTQAGSHPFQVTSVIVADTTYNYRGRPRTVALAKDDIGELPAGLIGNPTPLQQCTDVEFSTKPTIPLEPLRNGCPASSAIGVAVLHLAGIGVGLGADTEVIPIFNMKPLLGEPARFGFEVSGIVPVFLNTSVRAGSDYGVTLSSHNIIQTVWLSSVKLTFWGVPGSSLHDGQRGWECLDKFGSCSSSNTLTPPPFLIMPTSCEVPFSSTLHADAWAYEEKPSEVAEPFTYTLPEKIDGCNHLPFAPSIEANPDLPNASTSTGLTVDVHVPQGAELNPEGLAESSVKDITVTLPEGVALNPSAGNGVQSCSDALVGYLPGESNPPEELHFTPRVPGSFGSEETLQPGVNFCPNASKVATANIRTPLLPNELTGAVYLADQNANPFGSLIAMYLVVEDPVSGTLVKLPGEVSLNQQTGQLTATFKNSPQLPFEDAILHFFGGERAPLATPAHCGPYTTDASFVPWSAEKDSEAPVTVAASSTFNLTSGPHGSACPGQNLPFAPSLTTGSTDVQAGGFSPFTLTMGREDGNQNLSSIELHMPPGLSGTLSHVKLCPEAQANEGTCGPESLIGETTISVGVGNEPFTVTGGRVYITEKYGSAPFGLSIVNPAKAGPFDLEHDTSNPAQQPACDCIVVRAKIDVDPVTSALTVTSNPPGSEYSIPTVIDGIPLQIKHVNVAITRPEFTFNPTNCDKLAITGTLLSAEDASDELSVPFQVTDCRALAFKPAFSVSTPGKPSRANGVGLDVKLSYPKEPLGSETNVAKVKVELPKQLPSRLTTLQKACPAATFKASPASCPAASRVGEATAITPLVPVPISGPAYFVSNGGAKFPELILVLSGYGITVDLHGETFISKEGITSSTFPAVPDVPISTFELKLPAGSDSALAGNGNLCAAKLVMPTFFTAQNGATLTQQTPIAVQGCKATIRVVDHSVKGSRASIRVTVPSAGTLVATGAGIKRSVTRISAAGTVTIGVTLASHGLHVLAKNPHQRVNAEVTLRLTPAHGAPLTAHVSLLLG
jgi:hypothetical protein